MSDLSKKTKFFQIFQQSYKLQLIVCIGLSLFILALYFIINKSISINYTITNDIKLINNIEKVDVEDNIISIYGYSFLLDMDSSNTDINIILRNVDDREDIRANVEQKSREDVASYFKSDYNYTNSGFNAKLKKKQLDADKCYEIIVKLDFKNADSKAASTNRYIMNGKLYDYNPFEFDLHNIDTNSALLNEVLNNGRLCFYIKEEGIYLFQYNDQLFWVANENFNFDYDGLTHIPFHLYTSKIDFLPENDRIIGYENRDFYFEEHEYTDEDTAPFRVAIMNIPKVYPITFITTGIYDAENKILFWQRQFQLLSMFDMR